VADDVNRPVSDANSLGRHDNNFAREVIYLTADESRSPVTLKAWPAHQTASRHSSAPAIQNCPQLLDLNRGPIVTLAVVNVVIKHDVVQDISMGGGGG